MQDCLVLNSSFMPLRIVSDREAICKLYKNDAYTVVESDKVMRSPSITMRIPTVIALIGYGSMPKRKVGFSKLNVIYRDDQRCQYCGKQFSMDKLTVDHIVPKSRWATIKRTSKKNWSNWLNTVCACKWCNNKKGNLLPEEAGMKLLKKPFEPKYLPYLVISKKIAEDRGWLPFCNITVRLVEML